MIFKTLVILSFACSVLITQANQTQMNNKPFNRPGGIIIMDIAKTSTQLPVVRYGLHEPVILEKENIYQVLIGIGLNTVPGDYLIFIDLPESDSSAFNKKFTVLPWLYPTFKQTDQTPIDFMHTKLSNLDYQNTQQPSLPLDYPAQGKWASFFGHTNITEQTTTQQNYISLSTTEFITVTAPQNAIVSRVSTSPSGLSTVFLDHGRGLYSVLSGLTNLSIEEGNGINRGAVIGKLPEQTSNTIPSKLIWQCILNGVYVDPEILTLL